MLVDELLIPHPEGCVRMRFDERATVVAGLDAAARSRLAHLLTSALAGAGPATVLVRDDLGRRGRIAPGTTADPDTRAPEPEQVATVHRRIVVGPTDLGLGLDADPAVTAERASVALAHRQLTAELAEVETGAMRRARLLAQLIALGDEPGAADDAERPGGADPAGDADHAGPADLDAVAASAAWIDELLQRRRDAGDVLERTAAVLQAMEDDPHLPPPPAAGDLRRAGGSLANGLLAARDVLRRVSGATLEAGADRRRAEVDAHIALARAQADIDQARRQAQGEIHACDRELAALALAAGVPVGVEGPGPALVHALAAQRHTPGGREAADPSTRVLIHKRAAQRTELRAWMEELPDDTAVTTTRRRLAAVADRLARLDETGGAGASASGDPVDLDRVRTALLGRVALLRPDGVTSVAPLVLDEALVGLAPDDLLDLLDLVVRVAERTQVVVLTGDAAVATWARHRAAGGQVRLVEPARA